MAILKILTKEDETLRRRSRPVTEITPHVIRLLDDMRDTLHKADGAGLAAVQVGVLRRIFIIETDPGNLIEMINPEIVSESEKRQHEIEGCLSVPGEWGVTDRPETVTVRAQNRYGEWFEVTGTGLKARCLCHEYDHLNGILYTDNAIEMLEPEDK